VVPTQEGLSVNLLQSHSKMSDLHPEGVDFWLVGVFGVKPCFSRTIFDPLKSPTFSEVLVGTRICLNS